MNLHKMVSGAIAAVNPQIPMTVKVSAGSTESPDGTSIPTYLADINTTGQKQDLSGKDIYRLQAQNIQGVVCKVYISGNFEGVFRVLDKGGDLLIFGGKVYLVKSVIERWPDWCCLALAMQLDNA